MPNLAGVVPVLSLLLGYGMKYFADWLQHNRTLERERETRSALRKDAIAERRTQFLSGQGKSGHAWSLQNRPYGMARDVVLIYPAFS